MTHQDAMNIAAQAWAQVKPEDDPPFDQCAPDHKFRLAYKVESVAKGGRLEDDFDCEVYRILNPPQGVSPVTPIPDAPPAAEDAGDSRPESESATDPATEAEAEPGAKSGPAPAKRKQRRAKAKAEN